MAPPDEHIGVVCCAVIDEAGDDVVRGLSENAQRDVGDGRAYAAGDRAARCGERCSRPELFARILPLSEPEGSPNANLPSSIVLFSGPCFMSLRTPRIASAPTCVRYWQSSP